MLVRQCALVKHLVYSQLHDWWLVRQSALVNRPMFRSSLIYVCGVSEHLQAVHCSQVPSFRHFPGLMLCATVSTCKAFSFRSFMIDVCGDSEHLSNILFLHWAMGKHPSFLDCYSHSYCTLTPTNATCKSSSCLLQQSALVNHPAFRSSMTDAWCGSEHL